MILCLLGEEFMLWVVPIGILTLLFSSLFIVLLVKYSQSQISRYLCDGVFCLYISIILNLASYRVMTLHSDSSCGLAILLMSLLVACIIISLFVVFFNIKSGKYSEAAPSKGIASLPFLGSAIGILVSRLLLQGQTQQEALSLLACVLLILSFIMSIPSLNLLKALFYKQYKDEPTTQKE